MGFVPAMLAFNITGIINSVERFSDVMIQYNALTSAQLVNALSRDQLGDDTALQRVAADVQSLALQLLHFDVLKPSADGFQIVASSDQEVIGVIGGGLRESVAWQQKQTVAYLAIKIINGNLLRVWTVATPMYNRAGEAVRLLTVDVSSEQVDVLAKSLINRSLIVLGATLFLIVLFIGVIMRSMHRQRLRFEALESRDELNSHYVHVVSTQLAKPLNDARWQLDLILHGDFGKLPSKAEMALQGVRDNIVLIHSAEQDLNAAVAAESGYIPLEKRAVNLAGVIKEALLEMEPQAVVKKIKLTFEQPVVQMPNCHVDVEKIRFVLAKLIDNAIRYTARGSIKISLSRSGHFLVCAVTDTGVGIKASEKLKIGERFYRGAAGRSIYPSGTGVGLAVAKLYVEKHGGKMWFTSEEGKGSVFSFAVPIAK